MRNFVLVLTVTALFTASLPAIGATDAPITAADPRVARSRSPRSPRRRSTNAANDSAALARVDPLVARARHDGEAELHSAQIALRTAYDAADELRAIIDPSVAPLTQTLATRAQLMLEQLKSSLRSVVDHGGAATPSVAAAGLSAADFAHYNAFLDTVTRARSDAADLGALAARGDFAVAHWRDRVDALASRIHAASEQLPDAIHALSQA